MPVQVTAMSQTCLLCERRRARRACPALGQQICAVCCGTKRLVEIKCPSDCSYLKFSQSHPPAVIQRQQERDLRFLMPFLHGLSERQQKLLLLVQLFLRGNRADEPALHDEDIAQAACALAETHETANRGIIYEHTPASLNAQRLAADLTALLEAQAKEGSRVLDGDAAVVMRRVEASARQAGTVLPGSETAYRSLLKRILRDPGSAAPVTTEETGGSSLILPGR